MSRFWKTDVTPSEITPEPVWQARRRLLKSAGLAPLALGAPSLTRAESPHQPTGPVLAAQRNPKWSTGEPANSWQDITTYNNFYEFGTDKAEQPTTSWMRAAPQEYGFYANVNPTVPHPRWSQATERRIGSGFFAPRIPTQPFNGYEAEVAGLYKGMDLRRNF